MLTVIQKVFFHQNLTFVASLTLQSMSSKPANKITEFVINVNDNTEMSIDKQIQQELDAIQQPRMLSIFLLYYHL